ncbi:ADP-ribosylglycohydrolase family protein [Polyangium mundeleinium]|uniref:ADP-ribosylglycohydrolase family protein n=1 Tax=Polyangium mundeleinium TaxID=2995306 RepID=A0ABT5ET74_9BACT|nr:ADP-ribosylglycohydrolase family protein [Polyangium mundeleinium]MDC0744669.1 ADP-ribosylglycohydrolase family protein [Polyangium mundeleinium]
MSRPTDHASRMERALLALDGLSTGDAFGERFFVHPDHVERLNGERAVPAAPWAYTDDTVMALGIVEVLERHGTIDQDVLARVFARRYGAEPHRGYGGAAHEILRNILTEIPWQFTAKAVFGGTGSMGNGGAMRVAPLGAYFADDLDEVVRQAKASAEVTHAHPDGQAGAVAVAVAAAVAWHMGTGKEARSGEALLRAAFRHTPDGETKDGLANALTIPLDINPQAAASALGSGYRVLSWDTVPFALWCAARHLDSYEEALWTTVSGLGDRDTTCAMAGGVVALSAGRASIPSEWIAAREPLALGENG